MTGRTRMNLLSLVSVLAALVLALAACGGSDDSGEAGSETAAATTEAGTTAGETGSTLSAADADTVVKAPMADPAVGEYTFSLETSSVPAGVIAFEIENRGEIEHEFEVIKTDVPPDQLEVAGEKAEPEVGGGVEIGEVEDVEPGDTPTLVLELEAGNYVILCNLPGHYEQGMVAAFTVE